MSLARTPFDTLSLKYVSELTNLQLPDFQRESDTQHVNNIYSGIMDKLHNQQEPRLTGCLITVSTKEAIYLLDGNHRLKALRRILTEHGHDIRVYIQEIKVNDQQEAEELFNQANTSFPVAEMPTGVKRSTVNDIALYFYKKYTGGNAMKNREQLFKDNPTGTVRRPRISRSKFETALGQILEMGLSEETVKQRIDDHISSLNGKSLSYFKRSGNDTVAKLTQFIEVADLFGCRLGMDLTDNYFIRLAEIVQVQCEPKPVPAFKYIRPKETIPKALKIAVWNRYCGSKERSSTCPFCQEDIKLENFHCAHDVAESQGGATTIDNLYPCCSSCNLSMGVSRFEEWIMRFQSLKFKLILKDS